MISFKSSIKVLISIIISIIVGLIASSMITRAFIISEHPMLSLLMRGLFLALLAVLVISKKKEIFIYAIILGFPFLQINFSGIGVFPFSILLLLLLYKDEIIALSKKEKTSYKKPFVCIFLAMIFTTLIARNKSAVIPETVLFLSQAGAFFVYNAYLNSKKELTILLKLLMGLLGFCILISLIQFVFGISSVQFFFGEYNPNVGAAAVMKRIPSIFRDAQFAGQFFAIMLILGLGAIKSFLKKSIILNLIMLGSFLALILTISRVAIITFICVMFLLHVIKSSHAKRMLMIPLAIFVILGGICLKHELLPDKLKSRFSNYEIRQSLDFRYQIWVGSLPIIVNNPMGVGLGGRNVYDAGYKENVNFIEKFSDFPVLRKYTHFENSYLQVLYSLGFFGFLGFMGIFFVYFKLGFKIYKNANDKTKGLFALNLNGAMLIWAVCVFTSPQIRHIQPMFLFIILLAMMNGLSRICLANASGDKSNE